MPIFIRNYSWKQNNEKIHIVVPLKDVHASKLHLFTSEKYVKLNFSSYIFELILKGAILSSKSKCVIKSDEVILELVKEIPELWTQLQENVEKDHLSIVKESIIQKAHEIAVKEKEAREKEKFQRNQTLREQQLTANKEEKQMIQAVKNEQKAKAISELATWKTEQRNQFEKRFRKKSKIENEINLPNPVPFPRHDGVISFSFTPRLLPTPKRESKTEEEEEWLRKQAEATRSSGFVTADLNEEEKDPTWLLNKGMSFFKNENYLGALNAIEYATKIAPKMPILHLKLAATLLKLNRFPKAVDKATMALELLRPAVQQNKDLRSEALRIRAEAYNSIGESERSTADYEALKSVENE